MDERSLKPRPAREVVVVAVKPLALIKRTITMRTKRTLSPTNRNNLLGASS